MTRKRMTLVGAGAAVAVVILVFLVVVKGYFIGPILGGYTHPPCEQLPSKAEVSQAIAEHTSLVNKLIAVGDNVKVIAETPCPDHNRALVAIQVATAQQEASVRDILRNSDGFGVPATIERR